MASSIVISLFLGEGPTPAGPERTMLASHKGSVCAAIDLLCNDQRAATALSQVFVRKGRLELVTSKVSTV